MKCPRCHKEPARTHAIYGVMIGNKCRKQDEALRRATKPPEFYSQTMQARVQEQRDRYEKDVLPPYDFNGKPSEEFARAFPDKAKELFSEYEAVTGNTTELAHGS